MNVFYVLNGRRLKQYFIVAVALLFAVGVVYTERSNITVFSQSDPGAIYKVNTEKKLVALTFDISWGEKRPDPILDILKEKGVTKATFFLSSPWTKSHPEIVKRIVDGGYEIGSHGHKHINYSGLSDDEIRNQITTAHEILSQETGKTPNLIRMPNGDFDKRVLRIASELNYKVIQWDTDSHDWMNQGVDNIINRVVTKAHPGDIILLHASDSCNQTHLALPVIIDQLRAKGYEFVSVTELMNQSAASGQRINDQPQQQPVT